VTERFFALGFALEQMRHNLHDLHRCVTEWAQLPGPTSDAASRTAPHPDGQSGDLPQKAPVM
jgi:hypothetical protein